MQYLSFWNINLIFATILTMLYGCLNYRSIASVCLGVIAAEPLKELYFRNAVLKRVRIL